MHPGDSRWYNYYIEGLAWLVKNVDIDGLYLDDVTYDRRTVKRIRKVLDNEKPGCLHRSPFKYRILQSARQTSIQSISHT